MDEALTDAYLSHLGAARPAVADAAALRELQISHLHRVPFENLSVHAGEAIELVEDVLADKVARRRRGGICYELNGAFAGLLKALGYRVTPLAARVFDGETVGLPYDHLALRVDAPDRSGPWLADVGFGESHRFPLLLDSRSEQSDPTGTYQLIETEDGDLDLHRDGARKFRLETRPRVLADFVATCWYHRTSPRSSFTASLVCSRCTPSGRVTLSGRTLKITENGEQRAHTLPDAAAVLAAYREWFGITLEQEPVLGRF